MVAEDAEMQCVQFDMSVHIARFGYESELLTYIIDVVGKIEGVKSVESFHRIPLRGEVRFDLSIDIERPAEDKGREMSEFLMDSIIEVEHVQEVRELAWRRLKSPLL